MKINGKSINNISRTPKIVILVVIGVFVTGLLIGGSIEQTTAAKKMNIPGWVKNNAEWWAQGQISDEDFATGIEYMINDGIIKVQQAQAQTPTSSGEPFDELWDAIIKLQNDLANIQVSNGDQGPAGPPGAQGPQGPQGPAGDSSGSVDLSVIESRLSALENKPLPELQTRTIFSETTIPAGVGSSADPVFCNTDEKLVHGGWVTPSGIQGFVGSAPAPSDFQFITTENVGVNQDFQKGFFFNPTGFDYNVRLFGLCTKIVQP